MSDPKTLRDLLPDTNAGTINYVLANNGDGGFYWAAPGKTYGATAVAPAKLPPIEEGGTGKTNRQEAINALLPSQQKQNGKILVTDGLNVSWDYVGGGTVTSVNMTGGTTGLTFSGGPITTTGTFGLGGVLGIANGGTGETTTSGALNALLPSQTAASGYVLTSDNGNAVWKSTELKSQNTQVQ